MFHHQMFYLLTKYFINTFLFLFFLLSYEVTIVFCHLKSPKDLCSDKICRHQLFLFIYLFSNGAIGGQTYFS